jgi:hypothetical protein
MNYESLIPSTNHLEFYLGGQDRLLGDLPGTSLRKAFAAGLVGCIVDSEDAPAWARGIARHARARFRDQVRHGWRAEEIIPSAVQGIGAGKRACNFQFAMKLDSRILSGAQNFNNCAAWTAREIAGCCLAVDKVANGEAHGYTGRPGTAVPYGNRGTRADTGMTLRDAVLAVHNVAIGCEVSYLNGKYDLSSQSLDERAGVKWGGSGVPKDLVEVIKGDLIEQASEVQEESAVQDLLYAGHFIETGSTRTAGGPGDPISPIGSIGAHAQALIGYDDTEEFRDWYQQTTGKRITEAVYIFDQSWGEWLKVTNWPEHLWGPRPEGAFVLLAKHAMQLVQQWGEAIAMSKVAGFPLLNLPDWGSFEYL